jgi:hypothetical protein
MIGSWRRSVRQPISNRLRPREHLPLNPESRPPLSHRGLNDGVCVPLPSIFLTIARAEEASGQVESLKVVLEEIGFGTIGGVVAGALGAWVLGVFARWGAAGSSPPSSPGSSSASSSPTTPRRRRSWPSSPGNCSTPSLPAVRGDAAGSGAGRTGLRIALYTVGSLTVVRMLPVALGMLGTGMRRVTVGLRGLVRTVWPGLDRIRADPGRRASRSPAETWAFLSNKVVELFGSSRPRPRPRRHLEYFPHIGKPRPQRRQPSNNVYRLLVLNRIFFRDVESC